MLDSNERTKAIVESTFQVIIPVIIDNTVVFLCNIEQSSTRTGTNIEKFIELFHQSFDHRVNVTLIMFTMHYGSVFVCKSGFIQGNLSLCYRFSLTLLVIQTQFCFFKRLSYLKNTHEGPMGTNFMNLKATLFEAEGNYYKNLAITTSGFSFHKVYIQNSRVDLQFDPNQTGV